MNNAQEGLVLKLAQVLLSAVSIFGRCFAISSRVVFIPLIFIVFSVTTDMNFPLCPDAFSPSKIITSSANSFSISYLV